MDLHTVFQVGHTSPYSQADDDERKGKQGPAKGNEASADLVLACKHVW